MNYDILAAELFEVITKLHQNDLHRKLDGAVRGENFILQYIYSQSDNGHISPSDLSKEMYVSSARIAATLNSLEKKNLIQREINLKDRRQINISLTLKGYRLAKENYARRVAAVIDTLQTLGEEDSQSLIRILNKIAQRRTT